MTIQEAIKTLDSVIPPPANKMVDAAHMEIAIAWEKIKTVLRDAEKPEGDHANA